jgi:hypothetical protein
VTGVPARKTRHLPDQAPAPRCCRNHHRAICGTIPVLPISAPARVGIDSCCQLTSTGDWAVRMASAANCSWPFECVTSGSRPPVGAAIFTAQPIRPSGLPLPAPSRNKPLGRRLLAGSRIRLQLGPSIRPRDLRRQQPGPRWMPVARAWSGSAFHRSSSLVSLFFPSVTGCLWATTVVKPALKSPPPFDSGHWSTGNASLNQNSATT